MPSATVLASVTIGELHPARTAERLIASSFAFADDDPSVLFDFCISLIRSDLALMSGETHNQRNNDTAGEYVTTNLSSEKKSY